MKGTYRGYLVDPPCEGFRRTWQGIPTIQGLPALIADSEDDLKRMIDEARDEYHQRERGSPGGERRREG